MRPALRSIVYAAVSLALAIAVQALRLGQAVTGPAVNAVLETAAGVAGPAAGAVAGLFTPVFALMLGQLKPALAPAVPFIMVANALMVLTFALLLRRNGILAVVVAAIVKFLALWLPVKYFLRLPAPVVVAMGWPQLFTALAGGVVALAILRVLPQTRARGRSGR